MNILLTASDIGLNLLEALSLKSKELFIGLIPRLLALSNELFAKLSFGYIVLALVAPRFIVIVLTLGIISTHPAIITKLRDYVTETFFEKELNYWNYFTLRNLIGFIVAQAALRLTQLYLSGQNELPLYLEVISRVISVMTIPAKALVSGSLVAVSYLPVLSSNLTTTTGPETYLQVLANPQFLRLTLVLFSLLLLTAIIVVVLVDFTSETLAYLRGGHTPNPFNRRVFGAYA